MVICVWGWQCFCLQMCPFSVCVQHRGTNVPAFWIAGSVTWPALVTWPDGNTMLWPFHGGCVDSPLAMLSLSLPLQQAMCSVAQARPTLCDPMNCSPPGSSVHGIFQARILKWAAISYSRRVTGEAPGNGCSVTLRPGVRVPTMCGWPAVKSTVGIWYQQEINVFLWVILGVVCCCFRTWLGPSRSIQYWKSF